MVLKIENKGKYDLFPFSIYLSKQFAQIQNQLIDNEKLVLFDKFLHGYLSDIDDINSSQTNAISAQELIKIAQNNVISTRSSGLITLSINDKITIPNTHIKIEPLCRLLNYGNFDLPPYPIFDLTFDYISNHINELYILYKQDI